jgi:hypothetical protein
MDNDDLLSGVPNPYTYAPLITLLPGVKASLKGIENLQPSLYARYEKVQQLIKASSSSNLQNAVGTGSLQRINAEAEMLKTVLDWMNKRIEAVTGPTLE